MCNLATSRGHQTGEFEQTDDHITTSTHALPHGRPGQVGTAIGQNVIPPISPNLESCPESRPPPLDDATKVARPEAYARGRGLFAKIPADDIIRTHWPREWTFANCLPRTDRGTTLFYLLSFILALRLR